MAPKSKAKKAQMQFGEITQLHHNARSFPVYLTGPQLIDPVMVYIDTLPLKKRVELICNLVTKLRYENSPFTHLVTNQINRQLRLSCDLAYREGSQYSIYGSYHQFNAAAYRKRILKMIEDGTLTSDNPFVTTIVNMSKLHGISPTELVNTGLLHLSNDQWDTFLDNLKKAGYVDDTPDTEEEADDSGE